MSKLRRYFSLLLAAGFLLQSGPANAGSLSGHRRPIVKRIKTPTGSKQLRLAPGSVSDPVSDYGLGISGDIGSSGIHISSVDSDSPAERVGLEIDDVILTVNGHPILSVDDWISVMDQNNGHVRLRVRDGRNPG